MKVGVVQLLSATGLTLNRSMPARRESKPDQSLLFYFLCHLKLVLVGFTNRFNLDKQNSVSMKQKKNNSRLNM